MTSGTADLLGVEDLGLRGPHNRENAMAAAAVSLARGSPRRGQRRAAPFAGVAHRLEEVAELGGVLYVNDSKATNVASALVALASFPERACTRSSAAAAREAATRRCAMRSPPPVRPST